MTKNEDRSKIVAIKELLERDEDFVRTAVQGFVQAALEAEMTEVLAAEKVNGPGTARLSQRLLPKGSDYAGWHS
jgi:transposase-like protein